jgi:hypothetical protein
MRRNWARHSLIIRSSRLERTVTAALFEAGTFLIGASFEELAL